MLSTTRLLKLGLFDKTQQLLKGRDYQTLLTNAEIVSCAYHEGENPDGIVLDGGKLFVDWLKKSGFSMEMAEINLGNYALPVKLGIFNQWAEENLRIIDDKEISPEQFQTAMLRAIKRAGLDRYLLP